MIRFANEQDVEKISELWKAFHDDSLHHTGIPFDRSSATETTKNMMKNPESYIMLVADNDAPVVGMLIGMICPASWNRNELLAGECVWYVRKEHRGGSAGKELLSNFEKEAKDRGAKHIVMAHMCGENGRSLKAYYKRARYDQLEIHYIKGVL